MSVGNAVTSPSMARSPQSAHSRAHSKESTEINDIDKLCAVLGRSFSQDNQDYTVSKNLLSMIKKSIPILKK